jgi:hypothetical protein
VDVVEERTSKSGRPEEWASRRVGVLKSGHPEEWASRRVGIPKKEWASRRVGIPKSGHPEEWTSRRVGVPKIGVFDSFDVEGDAQLRCTVRY